MSTYPPVEAKLDSPFETINMATWNEAKELLLSKSITWIFRGQGDATWQLQTSLEREVLVPLRQLISWATAPDWVLGTLFPNYERDMIDEFRKGAHLYLQGLPIPQHELDWLALMQHYGSPTRLLDFTYSPYVAAFFAFRDTGHSRERAVWMLNAEACFAAARTKYREDEQLHNLMRPHQEHPHTIQLAAIMGNQALFSLYLAATAQANHNVVIPLSAKWSNERMLVQQGLFVMPSNITKSFMDNVANIAIVEGEPILHKLTLPSAERMKVLRDLDQMNINDMSLFPGLEGYARSMSRRLLLQAFATNRE